MGYAFDILKPTRESISLSEILVSGAVQDLPIGGERNYAAIRFKTYVNSPEGQAVLNRLIDSGLTKWEALRAMYANHRQQNPYVVNYPEL